MGKERLTRSEQRELAMKLEYMKQDKPEKRHEIISLPHVDWNNLDKFDVFMSLVDPRSIEPFVQSDEGLYETLLKDVPEIIESYSNRDAVALIAGSSNFLFKLIPAILAKKDWNVHENLMIFESSYNIPALNSRNNFPENNYIPVLVAYKGDFKPQIRMNELNHSGMAVTLLHAFLRKGLHVLDIFPTFHNTILSVEHHGCTSTSFFMSPKQERACHNQINKILLGEIC